MTATAKIIFDDGTTMIVEADGTVQESKEVVRGAIGLNKKGEAVDSFFTPEVTTKPGTIPWKFKDGKQRTFIIFEGGRLGGSYVVEKV